MTSKCETSPSNSVSSHDTKRQHEVAQQLEQLRALRGVTVAVDKKCVVLTGTVHSYYHKQVAQETALRTCPGLKVYNEVDVVQTLS